MLRRGALVVAVAVAGCGGHAKRPSVPAAPELTTRTAVSGSIPTATPADFRRPTAIYRRHVRRELGAMLVSVARLRAAIARRDLAGARRAWLAADARYETIGAAYGAFGALDARINGRTAGLPGGARSRDFTGLHRIELALWGRRSTRDAAAPAARLAVDARRLRARVAHVEIDPLEYSLRAHEVLEDALHLQLAGRASRWSGAALVALRANIEGTRVVLGSLRALIRRRNAMIFDRAEASLAALEQALRRTERHGALPRWDALPRRERETVAGLTAAAAEQLASVPELIDPRPPRQPLRAFGPGAGR